jgi:hypothetical protein
VRPNNVIAANFKGDSRRTRSSMGGETIPWACDACRAIASTSWRYRGRRRYGPVFAHATFRPIRRHPPGETEAPRMSSRRHSLCSLRRAARAARSADAGPRHLHATHNRVCADFGMGRVAVRRAVARVSISNSRTSRVCVRFGFFLPRKPMSIADMRVGRFKLLAWVADIVISHPGESRDRHVCVAEPQGHDVLCMGIFLDEFVPSRKRCGCNSKQFAKGYRKCLIGKRTSATQCRRRWGKPYLYRDPQ